MRMCKHAHAGIRTTRMQQHTHSRRAHTTVNNTVMSPIGGIRELFHIAVVGDLVRVENARDREFLLLHCLDLRFALFEEEIRRVLADEFLKREDQLR